MHLSIGSECQCAFETEGGLDCADIIVLLVSAVLVICHVYFRTPSAPVAVFVAASICMSFIPFS